MMDRLTTVVKVQVTALGPRGASYSTLSPRFKHIAISEVLHLKHLIGLGSGLYSVFRGTCSGVLAK